MYVVYCLYVINMLDGEVLCYVIIEEKLYYIVLEIEVIVIDMLCELEDEGLNVVFCVCVMQFMMNCEGICCFVVEELGLLILMYCFVDSEVSFYDVVVVVGFFCIVKLVMSFFGKGQSFICLVEQFVQVWEYV